MMNEADLNLCLGVLRGYYPGEWDDGRNIVWTDALEDLDRDEALVAIKRMGRSEPYAVVSRFRDVVVAIRREDREAERGRHMLGTGWVGLAGTVRDDEPPADPEAVKKMIAMTRRALKRVDEEIG